ncbi:NYN domain-containing protein [Cohaesibacter intestini]|uniref:NYN domain-containing protein n=1 Tax=Cohaesibacter intestini TaxID=2211145 RepID=UPI000DE96290|nr:NYN domain-containing protein [Cohaesibacter intestini]
MYTALLIDGGHLRACFKKARQPYTVDAISDFASRCFVENETVYRIFYYDAPKYVGEKNTPISGEPRTFRDDETLLTDIAKVKNFALRKGRLKFGGWRLKPNVIRQIGEGTFSGEFRDSHFQPNFSQKGVDMALGLDVAAIAETKKVDQFMLVTADTDMAPALKHGRIRGMRAVVIKPNYERCFNLHDSLYQHADIVREVNVRNNPPEE